MPQHTTIKHSLGEWPVIIHDELHHSDEPRWLLEFNTIKTSYPVTSANFRTVGLALGYLKRMAHYTPDKSSTFHIIPWNNSWSIYFG